MALAGLVIERVSGERYRDFVARHLFGPLGMTESSFDLAGIPRERLAAGFVKGPDGNHPGPPHWRLGAGEAMGGLYSSVTDMAKFMAFELSAWPPRDEPDAGPLRRSSLREAQSVAGFAAPGAHESYGVSFVLQTDPKLGRVALYDGVTEEYCASMWLVPLKNVGVVAMSGTTDFAGLDELTRGALVLLEAADKAPPGH
jgi:CubicO group peptidase (beta-lactamase class C family)